MRRLLFKQAIQFLEKLAKQCINGVIIIAAMLCLSMVSAQATVGSDYSAPVVSNDAPYPHSRAFYPEVEFPPAAKISQQELQFPTTDSATGLCDGVGPAVQPFNNKDFNPLWCQIPQHKQLRRIALAIPPGKAPAAGWPLLILLGVQESQSSVYPLSPSDISPLFLNKNIFSNAWDWPEDQGYPEKAGRPLYAYGYGVRNHILQAYLAKGIAVLYVLPWSQELKNDDWAILDRYSNTPGGVNDDALSWPKSPDQAFFRNLMYKLDHGKLSSDKFDMNNLFMMGYSSAAGMVSRLINQFPQITQLDDSGNDTKNPMPSIKGAILVAGGSYLCYSDEAGTAENNLTCPSAQYDKGICCPPDATEPYYDTATKVSQSHPAVLLAQSYYDTSQADAMAAAFYKAKMDQIAPGKAWIKTSSSNPNVTHVFFPEMVIPSVNFVLDNIRGGAEKILSKKTKSYFQYIYPYMNLNSGKVFNQAYISQHIGLIYWPLLDSLSSNQLVSGGGSWQGDDLVDTPWEGFNYSAVGSSRSGVANDGGPPMPLFNDIWNASFMSAGDASKYYVSTISKYNPFNLQGFAAASGFASNSYIEVSSTGHDWFAYNTPGSGVFINLKNTIAAHNKIEAVYKLLSQLHQTDPKTYSAASTSYSYHDMAIQLLSTDTANTILRQKLDNSSSQVALAQTWCQSDPDHAELTGDDENSKLACFLKMAATHNPLMQVSNSSAEATAAYKVNKFADMGGLWDHFIAYYAQQLKIDTVQMTIQPNENGGWMFEIAYPSLLGSRSAVFEPNEGTAFPYVIQLTSNDPGFDNKVPLFTCKQLAANGSCELGQEYPDASTAQAQDLWYGQSGAGTCNPKIPISMALCGLATPSSNPLPQPGTDTTETITWPSNGTGTAAVDANGNGSLTFSADATDSKGLPITYNVQLVGTGTARPTVKSGLFILSGVGQTGGTVQVIASSSSGLRLAGKVIRIEHNLPTDSIIWPSNGAGTASVDATGSGTLIFRDDASDSEGGMVAYELKLTGPGYAIKGSYNSFNLTGVTTAGESAQVIAISSAGAVKTGIQIPIKILKPSPSSWHIQSGTIQITVIDEQGNTVQQARIQVGGNLDANGNNQNVNPPSFSLEANKSYQISASGLVQITNGQINLNCRAKSITQSFSKDSNLQLEYSCIAANAVGR